jgi:hypothetical protein
MITEYTTASVELALSLANMFYFVLATCLLTSHSFCSFSGCESSRDTFTKREFCKTDNKQADQESYHPPPPPSPPPTVTTLVLSPNKKKPRNRPNYARGRRKIREIPITIASTIMRSTSHRPPFSSLSLSIGVG